MPAQGAHKGRNVSSVKTIRKLVCLPATAPQMVLRPRKPAKPLVQCKTGPDARGPRLCLKCQKPFQKGERWRKVWDADHVYAVGIHFSCPKDSS
jgi:hypothetical protein